MECDDNGFSRALPAAAGGRLKRKCGARGTGVLRLAFSAAVPGPGPARPLQSPHHAPRAAAGPVSASLHHQDSPFMNNMDEISYWICTKRAPCLFNYDNIVKKQVEQAQCSTTKAPSVKSKNDEEPSPRKKRKIKLLDEDSVSTEKQQNVYFKTPENQKIELSSCKSDDSDIDFNIKSPSAQKKSKKMKLQKKSQTRVSKKSKVSTTRPKIVILRRSLRTAQRNSFNNQHDSLNCSFQLYNASVVNGKTDKAEETTPPHKVPSNERSKSKVILPEKGPNVVALNGQFEDLSDVSGFTANYIRSTKMQSSKKPHKCRNQNNRTLSKHAKQREQQDKVIICVNKSVNTGIPDTAALNCSTDSSKNALKLVTVTKNEKLSGVNKSTSLLKFMDTKLDVSNSNSKINKAESKNNLNISFQSRSSGASRYPRRHKNNTTDTPEANCSTDVINPKANASRRYNKRKGTLNLNKKEDSEEKVVSSARRGRRRNIKIDAEESGCSVLQLNSSTEQVSSSHAVNVACPDTKDAKKNNTTSRCLRSRTVRDKVGQLCNDSASEGSNKKLSDGMNCALKPKCVRKAKKMDKTGQSLRDSSRDKSGFAACFSDSDSDCEPLKQRKFFS